MSTKLVNPTGKNASIYDVDNDVTYFDASVVDRVPHMIRSLVYIWAVLVVIGTILISRRPKETSEESQKIFAT